MVLYSQSNWFVIFEITDIQNNTVVVFYDIHGRELINQKLSSDGQVSVKMLKKGLYIYKVYSGENLYKGKLIIQ